MVLPCVQLGFLNVCVYEREEEDRRRMRGRGGGKEERRGRKSVRRQKESGREWC